MHERVAMCQCGPSLVEMSKDRDPAVVAEYQQQGSGRPATSYRYVEIKMPSLELDGFPDFLRIRDIQENYDNFMYLL